MALDVQWSVSAVECQGLSTVSITSSFVKGPTRKRGHCYAGFCWHDFFATKTCPDAKAATARDPVMQQLKFVCVQICQFLPSDRTAGSVEAMP